MWLGKENIPAILWALQLKIAKQRPDMVMVECVPSFDIWWLEQLSGNFLKFSATVLGPPDAGVPCSGDRLWAASAKEQLAFEELPFTESTVSKFIRQSVRATPHIWMVASDSEIVDYTWHVSKGQAIQPHPRGKQFRAEDLLPSGAHCRLVTHRMKASEVRANAPHLCSAGFFFDIGRLVSFAKKPDGLMPRQLTHSQIWSEADARLVTPIELLAAQGS